MSYFLSSEAIAIAMAMGSVVNKIPMQEGPLVGRAGCILEGRASEEGKKEGGEKKERKEGKMAVAERRTGTPCMSTLVSCDSCPCHDGETKLNVRG